MSKSESLCRESQHLGWLPGGERHCLSQLHSEKNGGCSVKSVKNVFISLLCFL